MTLCTLAKYAEKREALLEEFRTAESPLLKLEVHRKIQVVLRKVKTVKSELCLNGRMRSAIFW